MEKVNYKEKLRSVTTFVFDVDGVLTDGQVLFIGDQVVRNLNSRDGYALQYAAKMGYRLLFITGGNSSEIETRLMNLGATEVCMGSGDKLDVYDKLKAKYGFKDEEVLYMGDDVPDYHVMKLVGVACCPFDAAVEIKAIADYHSPCPGGRHCVRDVIEQTLRVQDQWFKDQAFHW